MTKKRKTGGWRYKNLTLTVIGIGFAYYLSKTLAFNNFLEYLGGFGYVGSIFAGMLFVSTFTVATGAVILFRLAESLDPIEIALLAGSGALMGDLLIFRFVRNNLKEELELIFNENFNGKYFRKLFKTKYFNWTLPFIGAVLIASPLPDEIGISLMSISKMNVLKFAVLSFVLNSIGIFIVISLSVITK